MRRCKYDRAMAAFGDRARYPTVVEAVLKEIPDDFIEKLSGKDLGRLMAIIDSNYHAGRASCGAEVVDGDAIWIDKLGHLYEIEDIRKLPSANSKNK